MEGWLLSSPVCRGPTGLAAVARGHTVREPIRTETVGEEWTSTAVSGAKPQNHPSKVRCKLREHRLTLPQSKRPEQVGRPGWQQLMLSTPPVHTVSSGHPQWAGVAHGPRGHREMAEDLQGKWHRRLALTGSSGWSRAAPGSLSLGSRVRSGRRIPSPAPTHTGGTQGTVHDTCERARCQPPSNPARARRT